MSEFQNENVDTNIEPAKKMNTIYIIIGIVALGVVYFASSYFSPERVLERATGVNYDVNSDGNGTIKIKGEDGAQVEVSTEGTASLPKSWPDTLPIYKNAKIENSGTISDGKGTKSLTLTFTVNDNANDVIAYYTDKLSSNGWVSAANINTGDGAMISAQQGENVATAYISKSEKETSVSLTVQIKE